MQVLGILLLLLASAEPSFSLKPADCEAAVPKAGEILNQINEKRNEGYLFQLLRVADAHTDSHVHTDGHEKESEIIHYLVLDVIESECSVLSRIHWEDCQPEGGRKPSEIVIGKCKVVAISHPNTSCDQEPLDKVIAFNCTTSSVSSALSDRKTAPVIIDFFEDREQFRGLAERALRQYQESDVSTSSFQVVKVERAQRARGGEGTNLFLEFSIRNHSAEGAGSPPTSRRFFRSCPVYGFCQATFVYSVENSDLNNPEHLTVSCEIFNVEDSRNFSSGRHHHRHHYHSSRGHPKHRHLGHGCREPPHHHHTHEHREPHHTHHSEEKEPKVGTEKKLLSSPDNSPVRDEAELHHPQGIPSPFEHDESHDHHMQDLHKSCPHGQDSQKRPHGHGFHGHGSHGHGSHGHHSHDHGSHDHGSHGHGSHGHGSHGHGSHGHGSHGHGPHRHRPHSHGPCRHGPPPGHSEEQDFPTGFPFHWREPGVVYQLPPLKKGEVLPLPEISIPSKDHCPHPGSKHHPKIEIQPFPQTSSESCPGKLQNFQQVLPFLEHKAAK